MLFIELTYYIYLFTRRCIEWLMWKPKGEHFTRHNPGVTECNNNNNFSMSLVFHKRYFLTWCPLMQWPWLIFQRAQLAGCLSFVLLCSYLLEELHILFRKMLVPPRWTVDVSDYKAQLPPFQWWEKVLSILSVQKMSHNMYVTSNL